MTTIFKIIDRIIEPIKFTAQWCFGLCLMGLITAITSPARAGELTAGRVAVVAAIVDGDTVLLADGGEVRLTGIQAPKLPLGRRNFKTWPYAKVAKKVISQLTLGKKVRLFFDGRRMDRHGRILAHLQLSAQALGAKFRADPKSWVQGAMVARGLARVYSFADNRAMTARLLVFEIAARKAKRNIWGHEFYHLRQPETVLKYYRSFQLVEGRVLKAARVGRRIYLNFGEDWRQDFTVQIEPRAMRLFAAAGLAAPSYQGKRIRVRGWIDRYNGPMIRASHPEQIEILAD